MKKLFLVLCLLSFSCESRPGGSLSDSIPSSTDEAPTPNVIFIMADDLGYGDLGSYGQKENLSPNLDQMAKEGMRFLDAYSGAPVCAPARSTLMTGMHTGRTTVRGNFGIEGGVLGLGGGEGRVPLKDSDFTIAELMKHAGYVTGMAGKWGLGEPETSGEPNRQGFDNWFGHLNQRLAHSYYPDFLWRNKEKVEYPENAGGAKGQYSHDLFTEFALEFIEDNRERKFFLYLPYTIPHAKYEIPDWGEFADRDWTDDEKTHASMIKRMDRDVGRILESLKRLNLEKDTIVFFCSDNGAAQRWEGRFDSSGLLRGRKRDMYEGGIRTPMIVRYPRVVEAQSTTDAPVYFPDILPTLAELTDLPIPDWIDGSSFLSVLKGSPFTHLERTMYWEFFGKGFKQAVRQGKWKGVKSTAAASWEIFDLSNDIGEQNNLAELHPEIVAQFDEFVQVAREPSAEWPSPID